MLRWRLYECALGGCCVRACSGQQKLFSYKEEKMKVTVMARELWRENGRPLTSSPLAPFLRYNKSYNNREPTYVRQDGPGILFVDFAQ